MTKKILSIFFAITLLITPSFLYAEDGYTWTAQTGSGEREWSHVAISSDGTKMVASVFGDSIDDSNNYIYLSTDSGVTWSPLTAAGERDWYNVAASSDLNYILAGDRDNGSLYFSTDGGDTFNVMTGAGTKNWWPVAVSDDGTKLVAGQSNGSFVYSLDSGVTWASSTVTGAGDFGGENIASTKDFSVLAVPAGDTIFLSTDYGATWEEKTNSFVSGTGYSGVSISDDGLKIYGNTYYGRVIISDDGGDTWATSSSPILEGRKIPTSPNGQITLAVSGNNNFLRTSTDGGATWVTQTSAGSRDWYGAEVSDSGNFLVAPARNGYIYTATGDIAPTVESFSPSDNGNDIELTDNLVITFSEAVDVGSGNIVIKNVDSGATVETIAVGDAKVTGTGTDTITINPDATLEADTNYAVEIGGAAFDNASDKSYSGIYDSITWNFRTLTHSGGGITLTTPNTPSLDVDTKNNTHLLTVQYSSGNIATNAYGYVMTDEDGDSATTTIATNITGQDNYFFSKRLQDLTCDTNYTFKAFAQNDIATTYSSDVSLDTDGCDDEEEDTTSSSGGSSSTDTDDTDTTPETTTTTETSMETRINEIAVLAETLDLTIDMDLIRLLVVIGVL